MATSHEAEVVLAGPINPPVSETSTPESPRLVYAGDSQPTRDGIGWTASRPSGTQGSPVPPDQPEIAPVPPGGARDQADVAHAANAPVKTAEQRLHDFLLRRKLYLLGGGVVAAVVLVVAVLMLNAGGPKTIFDAGVGDCVNTVTGKSITSVVLTVPCRDQHDLEVYFSTTYSTQDSAFPGESTLTNFGQGICNSHFTEYVGKSPEDSDFLFVVIPPDQQAWSGGTRNIMCAIGAGDYSNSYGSQRGSSN